MFAVGGPYNTPSSAGNFGVTYGTKRLPLPTTLVAVIVERESGGAEAGDKVMEMIRVNPEQSYVPADVKGRILYNLTFESINAKWAFSLRQGDSASNPVLLAYQQPRQTGFWLGLDDAPAGECKKSSLPIGSRNFKAKLGGKKYEWVKNNDDEMPRVLECHIDKQLAATCSWLNDAACAARIVLKPGFDAVVATVLASTLAVSEAEFGADQVSWSTTYVVADTS